jgi:hypothetical protein
MTTPHSRLVKTHRPSRPGAIPPPIAQSSDDHKGREARGKLDNDIKQRQAGKARRVVVSTSGLAALIKETDGD